MNTGPKLEAAVERMYARVQRYGGWHEVSNRRVYAIFAEIVALPGFGASGPGVLTRATHPDVVQILSLDAFKGSVFGLIWGVHLRFVPNGIQRSGAHKSGVKVPTPTLFEMVDHQLALPKPAPGEPGYCFVQTLIGEQCVRDDMTEAWRTLRPIIEAWFENAKTLEDVERIAADQASRDWTGFPHHVPEPALARCFVLARLGKVDDARGELAHLIRSGSLQDEGGKIRKQLTKVGAN